MNIYVGSLSYEVTEQDLQTAFEPFGKVDSVSLIKDRDTGSSKGFAFVDMPSNSEAQAAIAGLNGKELKGRTLSVNQARGRTDRPGGGRGQSYGGDRGGYGGGRGRRY